MQKIIIELFSGSKTVSSIFEKNGWQSFTVDINPKLNPQLCCDVCNISQGMLPKNPSFIWASPDCTRFSRASSQHHWKKVTNKYRQYTYFAQTQEAFKALQMIEATVNLIGLLPNIPFVIENPIGRIHHTAPMKRLGHYRYAVNYADFGFSYSKETYLFTNIWLPFSTKKVHSDMPGVRSLKSKYNRSLVPPDLIQKIIDYIQ